MRFYAKSHKHYCGIDLHARKMYLCILDTEGNVLLHRDLTSGGEFPPDNRSLSRGSRGRRRMHVCLVWLADVCGREGIDFVLGHALYMKAIHGGKGKTDKIDARKIAGMLRGGMFPLAYVYPPAMRGKVLLFGRLQPGNFMPADGGTTGDDKADNAEHGAGKGRPEQSVSPRNAARFRIQRRVGLSELPPASRQNGARCHPRQNGCAAGGDLPGESMHIQIEFYH
jgi:hypothetical protein